MLTLEGGADFKKGKTLNLLVLQFLIEKNETDSIKYNVINLDRK